MRDLGAARDYLAGPGMDTRGWVFLGLVEEIHVTAEACWVDGVVTTGQAPDGSPFRARLVPLLTCAKGDEVLLVCPSGDLNQAVCLGRMESLTHPRGDSYLVLPGGSTLRITGNLDVSGNGRVRGALTVDGAVSAGNGDSGTGVVFNTGIPGQLAGISVSNGIVTSITFV